MGSRHGNQETQFLAQSKKANARNLKRLFKKKLHSPKDALLTITRKYVSNTLKFCMSFRFSHSILSN